MLRADGQKTCSTPYSRVVPHPSTNDTHSCLTSEFRNGIGCFQLDMTARCRRVPLHGSWTDGAGSTGVHLSWTQPHVRASTHMHRVHRSYPQRTTPSSQRATCNALSPAHTTRFSECTNVCVDACRHRCRSSTGLEVGDPPPSSVCMCVCRQHRGKEEEEEGDWKVG